MAAIGGAPQQGVSPLGGPAAPTSGLRWRRVFPGEERQLGVLRRWLASLLPDCPARDDVACVASELGSNAVRHTASGREGWFAVEITFHRSVVRVAVADCGAPAGPRVIDDPAGEHGRGLLVVKGLSARTGVCGDHRGRLVWADVPWDEAGAAEPVSPQDRYQAAIRDGQAGLATRFAGVSVWFGRSTLQWWALAGGELVTAPSAAELAGQLRRLLGAHPLRPPAPRRTGCVQTVGAQAGGRPRGNPPVRVRRGGPTGRPARAWRSPRARARRASSPSAASAGSACGRPGASRAPSKKPRAPPSSRRRPDETGVARPAARQSGTARVQKAARAAGVVTAPAARALDAASQLLVDLPGGMDEHLPQIRNWTPGVHPRGKKENSVASR